MREHWAFAEAVTAPFESIEAFRQARIELAAEDLEHLRDRLVPLGSPVPDAALFRTAAYPNANAKLLDGLADVARRLLIDDGDACRLGRMDAPGTEILRWRAVSLRVPIGHLLAAACHGRPTPRVRLLHRGIAPAGPIALQHLHLKAACDFELLWAHLCGRRRAPKLKGAPAGLSVDEWIALLTRARLARLWLRQPVRPTDSLVRHGLRQFVRGDVQPLSGWDERRLWRLGNLHTPQGDPWLDDPLADGRPWPEGLLLQRAFVRSRQDDQFARAFTQYLRVRTLLHSHLTHDPTTPSLGVFVETFDLLGAYRSGMRSAALVDAAVDEPDLDLSAVEMRVSPPARAREVRETIRAIAGPNERGLIYHFIRNGGGSLRRCVRRSRRGGRRLMAVLRGDPKRLRWVRGLDVAGHERVGPLWAFAPTLVRLRTASARLGRRVGLPGLRLSVHAGEDFDTLLSGLRAAHEPLLWRWLRPGERLGHALALGIDPEHPRFASGTIQVSRWRRMVDLSWALSVLPASAELSGPQLQSFRDELDSLHSHARTLHVRLGDVQRIAWLLSDGAPAGDVERLISARLAEHPALVEQPVDVDRARDRPLAAALQRHVARELALAGITVELNPSSNLIVAGLDDPVDQPLYRLRPLDPSKSGVLSVSLNTDDPLQFATRLADEYAYAWAGITIAAKKPGSWARAWLDEAAASGWRSRFTLAPH